MSTELTASAPARINGEGDFNDRFWYWQGASGRRYIHSVYTPSACPPLPRALFIAVRREGSRRVALGLGRFGDVWDSDGTPIAARGADEIHVHLLAKGEEDTQDILADLRESLRLAATAPAPARAMAPLRPLPLFEPLALSRAA